MRDPIPDSVKEKIKQLSADYPALPQARIAKMAGVSPAYVSTVLKNANKKESGDFDVNQYKCWLTGTGE